MPSTPVPAGPASAPAAVPVYDSARRPHPFVEELLELWRYRDLVLQWSLRNLTLRYKKSALGVLWTLIEPLMLMAILAVVFSTIFKFMDRYPVYLLAGLLLFDFLSRSTLQISDEIVESQSLAKRIHVPRSAFAVAWILTFLVNWLIALLPLLAIMLWFDGQLTWALLTVPLGIVLTALFALGVGLMVATLAAFFQDVRLTYQVLLTAWLYATPIIYPLSIVPESLQGYFRLNPMLHLCTLVRDPVYYERVAAPETWAIGVALSLGAVLLGWWTFTHWRNAFDYRS